MSALQEQTEQLVHKGVTFDISLYYFGLGSYKELDETGESGTVICTS